MFLISFIEVRQNQISPAKKSLESLNNNHFFCDVLECQQIHLLCMQKKQSKNMNDVLYRPLVMNKSLLKKAIDSVVRWLALIMINFTPMIWNCARFNSCNAKKVKLNTDVHVIAQKLLCFSVSSASAVFLCLDLKEAQTQSGSVSVGIANGKFCVDQCNFSNFLGAAVKGIGVLGTPTNTNIFNRIH